MGGALILTAIVVSTVLWADLENRFIWVVVFVTLAFGVIGYIDDYKKLILQDPAGLSAGKNCSGSQWRRSSPQFPCT